MKIYLIANPFSNIHQTWIHDQEPLNTTKLLISNGQQRLMYAKAMKTFTHLAPLLVLASACLVLVPRTLTQEIAVNVPIKEVFVTLEDGRTFALDYKPGERLLEFKKRIEDFEGILCHRQKLSLDDTELNNELRNLSEYNIKPGANLKLTLVSLKTESSVYVKTLDGKNVYVGIDFAKSVKKLKESATWWLTHGREPYTNLRLIHKGRSLRDDRRVLEYPIWAGTILLQGKQLEDCRGDAEILVHTLRGATIKCQVDLADTVGELERLIEAQTGVPREVQVLGYGKNRLRNEDHLCDHGLESGASVTLALYSRRVREQDDIGRLLCLPSAKSPQEVPIFREADDGEADAKRRKDIVKDAQNWIFESKKFADIVDSFNPVARLKLTHQDKILFNELARNSNITGIDDDMALYQLPSAGGRMYSTVRNHQLSGMSNISLERYDGQGIQLGTSWLPGEHLFANINNYAPSAFNDNEIVDMFEKSEAIRRQLEGCARTGDKNLSFAEQKQLNRELLLAYAKTASLVPPLLEVSYDEHVDRTDCLVYRGVSYDGRGIRLGANWQPGKHLGFDINNYAPDVLGDKEIMRLFENYETVRRLLESDARTGEVKLSLAKQKELNRELLKVYSEALGGVPPMVEIDGDEHVDGIDCPICRDDLATEEAVKLPCDHAFHLDCISEWLKQYSITDRVAFCPSCRRNFKIRAKLPQLSIE